MKKLIFVTMLLIAILPLLASLAFDEPVPLYDFDNYKLSTQKICPNGNQVLLFEQSNKGIRNNYMQIYSPENEALLAESVLIEPQGIIAHLIIHPDNSIALFQCVFGDDGPPMFILNTYDQTGNLLPELSNIQVSHTQASITPVSDGLGGLHFCAQEGNGSYRYQHIDAGGNLAHPVQGLNLQGNMGSGWGMIATEDHGALLSIPVLVNSIQSVKFVRIGADHQIAGEFAIPGLEGGLSNVLLMNADSDSFYAIWSISRTIFAHRISYSGECLWTQDWTPTGAATKSIETAVVSSEGKLIVYYATSSNGYRSYFDVIDPLGSVIHSQLTNLHEPGLSYDEYTKYPVADNEGGWFLACVGNEPFVQHFNSDFTSWPSALPLDSSDISLGRAYIKSQLYGGNLHLLYQIDQDHQNLIYSQIIDCQGNATYPAPGIPLQTGRSGSAYGLKTIALPGGLCFAMWHQGANAYFEQNKLMYNVISPFGISLFPTAQCFLEEAELQNHECFPITDSQVLVVWTRKYGYDYISRAQVLDISGDIAWEPEGRLLYSGHAKPIFSMLNGALYMARCTDNGIRLQRFVNGTASWQDNGILVGTHNPSWLGTDLQIEALSGNRVFWSQGWNSSCPEMSFMNIIDHEGNLQYPSTGLPLGDLGSDYCGLSPSHYYRQGETIFYVLAYHYRVWEYHDGPFGGYSWRYYADNKLQRINPDGSLGPAPSAEQNVGAGIQCFSEDAYYSEHNHYGYDGLSPSMRKYDLAGNQLWSVPLTHDSHIKNISALPDGRVLLASQRDDDLRNITLCYYSLLDSGGNIEIPDDSQWGAMVNPELDLLSTGYGAYLILRPTSSTQFSDYGGVQYYEVNTWANDDPHVSPSVQLLSQNYPNPFQEQTRICLKLDESGPTTLKIYNIRGQMVKTLCDGALPKGDSYLDWDGRDEKGKACASGVYILKARANKKSKTIKILKLQ